MVRMRRGMRQGANLIAVRKPKRTPRRLRIVPGSDTRVIDGGRSVQ